MFLSDSIHQDCTYTVRDKGAYILFYEGVPIDHCKHVPGPVSQYSSKSEYITASTLGMTLSHFRKLNNEIINKDPYVVPEQAPLVILYIKSAVCMAKNSKDTKHTRHISRRIQFVRNVE